MEYNVHQFPNLGYLTYKLTKDEMDFVWKKIDEAIEKDVVVNDRLAGNITKSLEMSLDGIDPIASKVISLSNEYSKKFYKPYQNLISTAATNVTTFSDWWVNFQYQNEFNPPHNHSGIYSWVVWMKIPTELDDQKILPIAVNSNSKLHISNFVFAYLNTLGTISHHVIPMGNAIEGTLALFPSQLKHSVNAFYNCDEPRISVAGNISLYGYPPKNK